MQTLRDLREALRMTQKDVASNAHRHQTWVSRIENSPNPTVGQLVGYVNALGCSLSLDIRLGQKIVFTFRSDPEWEPPARPRSKEAAALVPKGRVGRPRKYPETGQTKEGLG